MTMPNISHIANLPTQNKRALHSLFTTKRDTVLLLWQKYIRETSALQLREDVEAPDGVLEEFFDLMVDHVTTQEDYRLLRQRVFSGDISAFTPDATARLLIALKKTVVELLSTASDNAPGNFADIETIFDEILLRLSEYYHEMRYRALERRRSQNLQQRNDEIGRQLAAEKRRAAHFATSTALPKWPYRPLIRMKSFVELCRQYRRVSTTKTFRSFWLTNLAIK